MREKKTFAKRAKVLMSDEARKKYFLVYEGKDTELLYFEAIEKLKERNIKLVNILTGSLKSDLEISIKNNYLDRFYYECKL